MVLRVPPRLRAGSGTQGPLGPEAPSCRTTERHAAARSPKCHRAAPCSAAGCLRPVPRRTSLAAAAGVVVRRAPQPRGWRGAACRRLRGVGGRAAAGGGGEVGPGRGRKQGAGALLEAARAAARVGAVGGRRVGVASVSSARLVLCWSGCRLMSVFHMSLTRMSVSILLAVAYLVLPCRHISSTRHVFSTLVFYLSQTNLWPSAGFYPALPAP